MSDWTWEYVPDAANVVGGLTQAQIDQVESLASRIADAVAVRRIGTPFDVTEAVSNVKSYGEGPVMIWFLRDRKCAWPKCGRPAVYCDVHHLRHKEDGGETSLDNLVLACEFHHDVCIHRRGWQLILHPDGTTEARSPDGKQILYSHAPPTQNAA